MTDFETMPLTIPVTAEEMDRLEDYAMRNPVSLTANAHENFLHTSIDNWWAFILLAVWRRESAKRSTLSLLTVDDLIKAPVNSVAVGNNGERFVKSFLFGWVRISPDGHWISLGGEPLTLVRDHQVTHFE